MSVCWGCMTMTPTLRWAVAERGDSDVPERAQETFMREFYRQRSGARKKYREGKCDLMGRPACYDSCEFGGYCGEWKYTVWAPF